MCDIVNSPCKVCGADLPLHLGDYETSPEEVECYCSEHLPETDVRVFTLTENEYYDASQYAWTDTGHYRVKRYVLEFWEGWRMGIRALTDNAREHKEYNHPNVGADWVIEDR